MSEGGSTRLGAQSDDGPPATNLPLHPTVESILRAAPIGIGVTRDRVLVEVNDRFCAMVGYTRAELIGQNARLLYPSDEEFERVGQVKYAQIAQAGVGATEARFACKDGALIDVLLSSSPIDPADLSRGVTFTALDITDRKRTAQALHHKHAELDVIFSAAPEAIIYTDNDRCILRVNPAFTRAFGYSSAETVGQSTRMLYANEATYREQGQARQRISADIVDGPWHVEYLRRDGTTFVGETIGARVYDRAGDIIGFVAFVRETTAQSEAVRALHESEQRYRRLFEAATDAIFAADADTGELLDVNPRACDMVGRSREEIIGTHQSSLHPPEQLDYIRSEFMKATETRGWLLTDTVVIRRDGRHIPVEISSGGTIETGKRRIHFGIFRDISRRKADEAELRRSRALLAEAGRMAQVGGWELDLRTGEILLTEEHMRIHGLTRSKMPLEALLPVAHPDDLPRIHQAFDDCITGRAPYDVRHRIIRQTDSAVREVQAFGEVSERDADGNAVRITGAGQDITERVELEEQLRQSQKLEAIGQLAGGVAHDFNNILTAILGNVEVLRLGLDAQVEPDRIIQRGLDEIEVAGQRAADLTRQLLAFGRKQIIKPEIANPAELLAGMEKMLRRLIPEHIDLRIASEPGSWHIRTDIGQFQQVIMNLAVNARDAMPDGGKLRIRSANVTLGPGQRTLSPDARPGRHVQITVSDDGCGMSEQTRARLFEPFFTTKPTGAGTGLGLATVHGIVSQAGGHIVVESRPGHGTTFTVYLPAVTESAKQVAMSVKLEPALGGDEHVLICEDDDAVRKLAVRALSAHGYQVTEADAPEVAIALTMTMPRPPALLVTDVIMPGQNGRELAKALLARFADLRVLYDQRPPARNHRPPRRGRRRRQLPAKALRHPHALAAHPASAGRTARVAAAGMGSVYGNATDPAAEVVGRRAQKPRTPVRGTRCTGPQAHRPAVQPGLGLKSDRSAGRC